MTVQNASTGYISRFRGIDLYQGTMIGALRGEAIARICRNLRPIESELEVVGGNRLHSHLATPPYSRGPSTLLEAHSSNKDTLLFATDLFTVYRYDGADVWTPLGVAENAETRTPSSLHYWKAQAESTTDHISFANLYHSWMLYDEILYLTDGVNKPVRYDRVTDKYGLAGVMQPAENILSRKMLVAGGLAADSYTYSLCLEDSSNELIGNPAVKDLMVLNLANTKNWLYFDWEKAILQGNMDFNDSLVDTFSVWRTPEKGGAEGTVRVLVGREKIRPVVSTTASVTAGGILTDEATFFISLGVKVGYTVRFPLEFPVVSYRVSAVGVHTLTLLDPDGTPYSGLAWDASTHYFVCGGLFDDVNDLSAREVLFTDDTELTPEEQDHGVPPRATTCAVFGSRGNRAFWAGSEEFPNRVWYSIVGYADYVPLLSWRDIDPDDGDKIVALIAWKEKLLIFKQRSTAILSILGEPLEWTHSAKYLSVGAASSKLVLTVPALNGVIFMNEAREIYLLTGAGVKKVSLPVSKTLVAAPTIDDAFFLFRELKNEVWLVLSRKDAPYSYDGGLTDRDAFYKDPTKPSGTGSVKIAEGGGGLAPQGSCMLCLVLDTFDWFEKTQGGICGTQATGNYLALYGGAIIEEEPPDVGMKVDWITKRLHFLGAAAPVPPVPPAPGVDGYILVSDVFSSVFPAVGDTITLTDSSGATYVCLVSGYDAPPNAIYLTGDMGEVLSYTTIIWGSLPELLLVHTGTVVSRLQYETGFVYAGALDSWVGCWIIFVDSGGVTRISKIVYVKVWEETVAVGLRAFAYKPAFGSTFKVYRTTGRADKKISFEWEHFTNVLGNLLATKELKDILLTMSGHADVLLSYSLDETGGSDTITPADNFFILGVSILGVDKLSGGSAGTDLEEPVGNVSGRGLTLRITGSCFVPVRPRIKSLAITYKTLLGYKFR